MTPESVVTLITGSAGALVVLAINVWGLVRGWVVPKPVHDAERQRNALLEKENATLNESVAALKAQDAEKAAQLARLEEKVEHLETEIRRLTNA